ncbi:MAG: SCP2 sterol-binding domain-containing protein [Spirochaetota bacterium]|nr:SCP2 sterol-binding domain-containing protein [Spirochaetota bacterium]
MSVFKDTKHIEMILGEFWNELHEKMGQDFQDSDLSILFVIKNPDTHLFVAKDGVSIGDEAKGKKPTITMTMTGEAVHKFWLKKLNLVKALAKREIKTKGPVTKVMKFMPMADPGYELYKEYCEKYNLPLE